MKIVTIIALALAASTAFATEYASKKLSWSPMTNTGWSQTFYSCNFAQDQVEAHLETLGAQNIRVTCSGGIDWNWTSPVFINAKFDVPTNGTVTRDAKLAGRDSCAFNTEFLDRAIPMFPGVAVRARRTSCSGGRFDNWSYDVTVAE